MDSHAHISETSKYLCLSLVLFNVLTEWTMTELHVSELVFVLNKEAATVLAHCDGYVGDHVFVIAFRQVRAEVRHVLNEDFFKSHRLHHVSTHQDRLIILRRNLMLCVLEKALRK